MTTIANRQNCEEIKGRSPLIYATIYTPHRVLHKLYVGRARINAQIRVLRKSHLS